MNIILNTLAVKIDLSPIFRFWQSLKEVPEGVYVLLVTLLILIIGPIFIMWKVKDKAIRRQRLRDRTPEWQLHTMEVDLEVQVEGVAEPLKGSCSIGYKLRHCKECNVKSAEAGFRTGVKNVIRYLGCADWSEDIFDPKKVLASVFASPDPKCMFCNMFGEKTKPAVIDSVSFGPSDFFRKIERYALDRKAEKERVQVQEFEAAKHRMVVVERRLIREWNGFDGNRSGTWRTYDGLFRNFFEEECRREFSEFEEDWYPEDDD